jgi:hypothetical protein
MAAHMVYSAALESGEGTVARYYVFPASAGLTVKTKDGIAAFIGPGTTLDDSILGTAGSWVPPPDAWTLRPWDAVAQTNLQNSIAATKAAISPNGTVMPGLPAGFPASVPIWSP